MPQLPNRPDLEQLRHRARELQRAAATGDPRALRRVGGVASSVSLSAAQLALAREYGFASWARLKAEVEARRAGDAESRDAPIVPAMPPIETWRGMRQASADLLENRTGHDVEWWNRRVAERQPIDEVALRSWLTDEGVTGYAQTLLVWERFGYPDFLTAAADDLISGQYRDRPGLRRVLEAVVAALPAVGSVVIQARKTYISLVSPRRTFAVVQATTKNRVDLGLRLSGAVPGGRLLPAGQLRSGSMTVRIALTSAEDVDDELVGWLRRAYEENTAASGHRAAPRRRRTGTVSAPMRIVVEGFDLPGRRCGPNREGGWYENVHVALDSHSRGSSGLRIIPHSPWWATEPVAGDAEVAHWEIDVLVRRDQDGLDFAGPSVRGRRQDRHIGLSWGEVLEDRTFHLFRGAKLRLIDVEAGIIDAAARPGRRLVGRVRLTDAKGLPRCARVHPPVLTWSAEPA